MNNNTIEDVPLFISGILIFPNDDIRPYWTKPSALNIWIRKKLFKQRWVEFKKGKK